MTTTNEVTQDQWAGQVNIGDVRRLPFYLEDDDDLIVIQVVTASSVGTLMVKGTNYTVTTGPIPDITAVTSFTSSEVWFITRRTSSVQNTDLVTGDKLPAGALEDAIDLITRHLADDRSDWHKTIHVPDGEQPTQATLELADALVRASTYLFFDGTGALSYVAGLSDVGAVTFHADGIALVGSAYSSMRTLLNIAEITVTTTGDLITSINNLQVRLAAASQSGRVLMAGTDNLSEVADTSAVRPSWQLPWIHPYAEVQGFPIRNHPTFPTSTIRVGQGVTQPYYQWGSAGDSSSLKYTSDGKELKMDEGLDGQWGKNAKATWATGENSGGMRAGTTLAAETFVYVFIMGRSEDATTELGFDDSINGTGLAATAAVQTWADTAGGNRLFLRRIGMIVPDATPDVRPMQTTGGWVTHHTPIPVLSANVTSGANVAITCFTPEEATLVRLMVKWTPTTAGDLFTIRNTFTSGNGLGAASWADEIKAVGMVTLAPQYFELTMLIDIDQLLQALTDDGTNAPVVIHQLGYFDPRANSSKTT